MGKQGLPPYDIQDGRPVWKQDAQTLAKANIGQRIMGLVPNWKQHPPTMSDGSGWLDAQIRPLPNPKPSEIHEPEPIPNFNPANSRRMEQLVNTQAGINYPLRSLQSTPTSGIGGKGTEWQPKFVDGPLSSTAKTFSTGTANSGSWNKSTPSFGGPQESLQKPLDFNEFVSFLGGRQQGNSAPGDENYFTPSSTPAAQTETRSVAQALGRTAGAANSAAGAKALKSTTQAAEAWYSNGQPGRGKKNPPVPPVMGSVGVGGKNNPDDVKRVQQLLNAAIDDEELAGEKVPEDGKVTDAMLKLLAQYQSANGLQREAVVNYRSQTLKKLAENPLFDPRWSKYDDIIKKEVADYNAYFKEHYPEGFQALDWRRVKAMLWVEVRGPDVADPIDWQVWPLQIGRKKRDPGMPAIKYGLENTDRYVPAELRYKLQHQRMTAELNIRAGVAYIYDRAIANWKNVWRVTDPTERTYEVKPGDTLEGIAKSQHTTVGELLQDNDLNKDTATSIRPTNKLKYRLATEVPQWYDWPTASFRYNATGNPDYAAEVERNYRKIKRRW